MLDDLDRKLIALLKSDSRTPVTSLAKQLSVDRSTVSARLSDLVSSGTIEAFTLRVRDDIDSDAVRGVTPLAVDAQLTSDIVSALRRVPDIEQLHGTMGAWDLVVHITAPTMERFRVVLHYLRSIPGVRTTQTNFLLPPGGVQRESLA